MCLGAIEGQRHPNLLELQGDVSHLTGMLEPNLGSLQEHLLLTSPIVCVCTHTCMYEISQQGEDLHNAVNQKFPNDQGMLLQSLSGINDPSKPTIIHCKATKPNMESLLT